MPANLLPGETYVLKFVTDEWQPASTIAAFANRSPSLVSGYLNILLEKGKVERMWDGNLGVHYWKLKRDLRFHRASEE